VELTYDRWVRASFAPAEQPRHIVVVMVEQSGVRQWGASQNSQQSIGLPHLEQGRMASVPLVMPLPGRSLRFAKLVGDPGGVAAAQQPDQPAR
jgi:hypothetical protein